MPSARGGPLSFFASTAHGWEAFISFFKIAQAQRVCHVPTHAHQHYLERIVQSLQHFGYRRTQRFNCRSHHSVRSSSIPASAIATEPLVAHQVNANVDPYEGVLPRLHFVDIP